MTRCASWLGGTLLLACCVLLLGFDCGGGRDCVYGGSTRHSGETFASEDGCNTCSCEDGNVGCTARACVAQWWKSCGDPVCREHRVDPNVPPCTTEKLGEVCTTLGHPCDINDPCNVHLVCAYSDPTKQAGGCPISRARAKTDIRYLDADQLATVEKELRAVRLARWRYKTAPADSPPQLGFIIDDLGTSPAINPDGESVNLYGYTSMAVAALHVQAAEVAELKAQVAELTRQVKLQSAVPSQPRTARRR